MRTSKTSRPRTRAGRSPGRHRAGYAPGMTDLAGFTALVGGDHGLGVVSTLRPDTTIQSSVVNVGVLPHPVTGELVVAFVSQGGARRLGYLRARPRATVVLRASWQWAAAEGPVQLCGPDDPLPGVDAERLRLLLREIFTAAGGTHDDWDTYDATMAAERRTAVLVTRIASTPAPEPGGAPVLARLTGGLTDAAGQRLAVLPCVLWCAGDADRARRHPGQRGPRAARHDHPAGPGAAPGPAGGLYGRGLAAGVPGGGAAVIQGAPAGGRRQERRAGAARAGRAGAGHRAGAGRGRGSYGGRPRV